MAEVVDIMEKEERELTLFFVVFGKKSLITVFLLASILTKTMRIIEKRLIDIFKHYKINVLMLSLDQFNLFSSPSILKGNRFLFVSSINGFVLINRFYNLLLVWC